MLKLVAVIVVLLSGCAVEATTGGGTQSAITNAEDIAFGFCAMTARCNAHRQIDVGDCASLYLSLAPVLEASDAAVDACLAEMAADSCHGDGLPACTGLLR